MQRMLMGLILPLVLVHVSCAKKGDTTEASADAVAYTAEMAVTTVGGAFDDASGGTFTSELTSSGLGIQTACARPTASACTGSGPYTQTATYAGCSIGSSLYTLTGTAVIAYTNATCNTNFATTAGATATRVVSLVRTGPAGGQLTTVTEAHSAYDGTSIGAGQVLAMGSPANSATLAIAGVHKTFTIGGKTIFDHSIMTTTPITANSTLSRAGRSISAGAVAIYHNLAKYTATYTVSSPLVWTSGCCYPTSGTVTAAFTGSLSGTGSVTFSSTCGTATITRSNGDTQNFTMSYCE